MLRIRIFHNFPKVTNIVRHPCSKWQFIKNLCTYVEETFPSIFVPLSLKADPIFVVSCVLGMFLIYEVFAESMADNVLQDIVCYHADSSFNGNHG